MLHDVGNNRDCDVDHRNNTTLYHAILLHTIMNIQVRASYMSVTQHTSLYFIAFGLGLTAVIVVFTRIDWDAFVDTDTTHSAQ